MGPLRASVLRGQPIARLDPMRAAIRGPVPAPQGDDRAAVRSQLDRAQSSDQHRAGLPDPYDAALRSHPARRRQSGTGSVGSPRPVAGGAARGAWQVAPRWALGQAFEEFAEKLASGGVEAPAPSGGIVSRLLGALSRN